MRHRAAIRRATRRTLRGPLSGGSADQLPGSADLAGLWRDGVDTIGESTITIVSGSAADLMAAEFSFDSSAVTLQADTDEGGDIFFDSANAMAPIVRTGAEWYNLLNGSFVWIGPRGIGIWTVDMAAYQSRIQWYFGYYAAPTFGPTWAEPGTWDDDLIWSES